MCCFVVFNIYVVCKLGVFVNEGNLRALWVEIKVETKRAFERSYRNVVLSQSYTFVNLCPQTLWFYCKSIFLSSSLLQLVNWLQQHTACQVRLNPICISMEEIVSKTKVERCESLQKVTMTQCPTLADTIIHVRKTHIKIWDVPHVDSQHTLPNPHHNLSK